MDKQLHGRTALVTGAGNGLGAAQAIALSKLGARILIQDIDIASAERMASSIRQTGAEAEVLLFDIANVRDMRSAIDNAGAVDILVNNAGIGGGQMLSEVKQTQFDRMFTINVRGPFFATQAVVPGMKHRRFGRIINISSLLAVRGSPGNGHYAGAKAALISFVKCWALELGPFGITANAVVPSLTATQMTLDAISQVQLEAEAKENPMGRLGTPDDVANIVAFLASPKASFISGQTISANGASFVGAM